MFLHFDFNIWGWILVALNLFNIIVMPYMFGKPRKPYDMSSWIASLVGFVLVVLALGIIR